MNPGQILTSFVGNISKYGIQKNFEVVKHSNNIFELRGSLSLFLYIKVRSAEPYAWGLTKNRLDNFHKQNDTYAVILLAGSPEMGYFLTKCDVIYYTKEIWPLGKDGDYKIKPGIYLERNGPFNSFEEFSEFLTKTE